MGGHFPPGGGVGVRPHKSSSGSEGMTQRHIAMNGGKGSCFDPEAFLFYLSASAEIKLDSLEFPHLLFLGMNKSLSHMYRFFRCCLCHKMKCQGKKFS